MLNQYRLAIVWLLTLAPAVATALDTRQPSPPPHVPDDRMAAHHLTMVAINEMRPNAGVLTYVVNRFTQTEAYGLARFAVYVQSDGRVLGPGDAQDVVVRDVPGAVQARYRLGHVRVSVEIVPLLRGPSMGAPARHASPSAHSPRCASVPRADGAPGAGGPQHGSFVCVDRHPRYHNGMRPAVSVACPASPSRTRPERAPLTVQP